MKTLNGSMNCKHIWKRKMREREITWSKEVNWGSRDWKMIVCMSVRVEATFEVRVWKFLSPQISVRALTVAICTRISLLYSLACTRNLNNGPLFFVFWLTKNLDPTSLHGSDALSFFFSSKGVRWVHYKNGYRKTPLGRDTSKIKRGP